MSQPPRIFAPRARPTCGGWISGPRRRCPRDARPIMKGPSLYDLDFFWRTGANHCNLDKKLRPWRGGGSSGLKGYLTSGRIGGHLALRVGVRGPVMACYADQDPPLVT